MLTRKDYKAIAAIIKGEMHLNKLSPNIALGLADYMAADNPRFNRERFVQACGYDLNPRIQYSETGPASY